jgi:hypothetical protein
LVCYLTFTDEYSGAWLWATVFPYRFMSQVPLEVVRQALQSVFRRWGKAGSLRVDNGAPFGNPRMSSTSPLALWLIAIDVDLIWNKPRCPQQNAKVERMQGTSSRWVNFSSCANPEVLQQRLLEEAEVQRNWFRVKRLGSQTRCQAYPELETVLRPYEEDFFKVQRVYDFLAKKVYVRKADKAGCIMLYNQIYNLSTANKGNFIHIQFNAENQHWHFYSDKTLITTQAARNLSASMILNLTVCQ